jgi:hypothetical protein
MNELLWGALTQEWWDRLGAVYDRLNVLGYTLEQQRLRGHLPTEDQIRLQGACMQEFYGLLLRAGSNPDGPVIQDIL